MADGTASVLGGAASGAAGGAAVGSVVPGIGTAIGAVVGGIAGLVGGIFGASAASRAASGRASIMRQQAQQGISEAGFGFSQKVMGFNQFLGSATARAGASGFQKTGSIDQYLGQLSSVAKADVAQGIAHANLTATLQRQAADITEDTGNLQVASDLLGGVSSAASSFATAGSALKWWGT